jgi:hypothetical protein
MPRPIYFLLLLTGASVLHAAKPAAAERFKGGKLDWTRLNTGTAYWNRHSEWDSTLLGFMRANTSLNIDREWHATRPADLKQLCNYPFVYADNIASVPEAGARNLAEYLRRGGFLLIDACGNSSINPNPEVFFADQIKVLRKHFPELRVGVLKPDHEVFSIYFKMTEFPPQARPNDGGSWLDRYEFPLRAVFVGDRIVAMISLSGWQCAWAHIGGGEAAATNCMEMLTNVYIYAMTR